jgi:hypothetical protein
VIHLTESMLEDREARPQRSDLAPGVQPRVATGNFYR